MNLSLNHGQQTGDGLANVVLPAPLEPTTAHCSPVLICHDKPCSNQRSRCLTAILSTVISGLVVVPFTTGNPKTA